MAYKNWPTTLIQVNFTDISNYAAQYKKSRAKVKPKDDVSYSKRLSEGWYYKFFVFAAKRAFKFKSIGG
jgi:hypothetical protein